MGNVTVVESMAARLREGAENEGVKGAGEKELEVDCDGFVWDGSLGMQEVLELRAPTECSQLNKRRNLPLDRQQSLQLPDDLFDHGRLARGHDFRIL